MLLAGFGFMSRLYGLSIDNLVEVEMVLADGRIVVLNKDDDPGKFDLDMRTFFSERSQSDLLRFQICGGPCVVQVPPSA